MHCFDRNSRFDATGVLIIITPILAALLLIFITAIHNETLLTDSSFNNGQFVVMPKNCYLKTP